MATDRRDCTPERQADFRAGISAEREAEVLAAWHARRKQHLLEVRRRNGASLSLAAIGG